MSRVDIESEIAIADIVTIIDGPFKGMRGKVDNIDMTSQKMTILIDLFGQETPVEVDFAQISKN